MKTEIYNPVVSHFLPDRKGIMEGTLYISLDYECVKFTCPCGCGQVVSFKIINGPDRGLDHEWGLILKDNVATITPSIKQSGGCGSHYWIENNKVRWDT